MKVLESLVERDPGASYEVIVQSETNVLEMLILQSSAMKRNLELYPELLQLDGTYRLDDMHLFA